jgi:hypothetical protein
VSRPGRMALSVLGLGLVVAGIPTVLVSFVGWPLPASWPSLGEIGAALEDGWTPGTDFVLGLLAIVAWVLWAQLLRHVLAQANEQRRARHALAAGHAPPAVVPHRGMAARMAGWLVGGLMAASPMLASAALAESRPRIPVVLEDTRALDTTIALVESPAPAPVTDADVSHAPAYVVGTWDEQRDCLWNIAERYLGDAMRWGEILEMNAESAQPSGRALVEDPQHWVYPGMELRLPADASGPALRSPDVPRPDAGDVPVSPPSTSSSPAPAAAVPGPPATASPSTTVRTPAPPAPAPSVPLNEVWPEPPAAATPTTVSGDVAMPDPVPLGGNVMRLAAAVAVGLPIFAAGGIALRLNRRRRTQVARHRPGRDIVRPDRSLEPLERRLRAIAVDEAAEWVDAALRVLGAELRESTLPAPRITCVRAGELGLELLLAVPAAQAPASFVAADEGHVWRLDPAPDLEELQRRADDHLPVLPALISLGASPEGPLLVDLEALGTLSVEGDATRVAAFLAGAALELASAPWAEGIDVRVVGGPSALTGVDAITVVDDLSALVSELRHRATSMVDALGSRPSTLAARLDEPGEYWPPTVVVVVGSPRPEQVEELASLAGPGSGTAVVAPGPVAGVTWRLAVVADGFARLEPLGLDLQAATGADPSPDRSPPPEALDVSIASLDEEAIAGAASLLAAADHDEDVAPLVALGSEAPRSLPVHRRQRQEVWVDVLGPVEVTGWAEPVGRRRRLEELVTYLALHPERPVSGERIRCAVWTETELSAKSFVQAVSRARRHLGGPAFLPEAAGGAYGLNPDKVGCSWSLFKELTAAAAAARSNPAEAMGLWSQALALVQGEPFAGVAKGSYVWAWSEQVVYEMQVAITRAADALGTLALAQDDPETALWATRQGLLAMPEQLSLFDWEMRVAAHRRDVDGLNSAFHARRRAEQALDPLAEVPAETVELYEALRAGLQQRSGVGS